jgi:hypothetical protein
MTRFSALARYHDQRTTDDYMKIRQSFWVKIGRTGHDLQTQVTSNVLLGPFTILLNFLAHSNVVDRMWRACFFGQISSIRDFRPVFVLPATAPFFADAFLDRL